MEESPVDPLPPSSIGKAARLANPTTTLAQMSEKSSNAVPEKSRSAVSEIPPSMEKDSWNVLLAGLEDRNRQLVELASEQAAVLARLSAGSMATSAIPRQSTRQSTRKSTRQSTTISAGLLLSAEAPPIKPSWLQPSKMTRRASKDGTHVVGKRSRAKKRNISHGSDEGGFSLDRLVLLPTSPFKLFWDVLSVIAILCDAILLPLMAFQVEIKPLAWVFLLFWSCDLPLSFFFAFQKRNGTIEKRLRETAKNYLRFWFSIDLTIVCVDWLWHARTLPAGELFDAGRMNRLVRWLRVVKALRLLRLVKLRSLHREISVSIQETSLSIFLGISRLLCFLSVFLHYIACCWYAVGEASIGESWIQEWEEKGISKIHYYVLSFHWAISQFLPAPCKEHPQNINELVFTILVLFCGFVVFSSMLGRTVALITQWRTDAKKRMDAQQRVRAFFTKNNISSELASRILYHLDVNRDSASAAAVPDLEVITALPVSLQQDVFYELYNSTLAGCPLFSMLDQYFKPSCQCVVKDICEHAVEDGLEMKGNAVFKSGIEAVSMRFVVGGTLEYLPLQDTEEDHEPVNINITSQYLSEAAIWLEWSHRGSATVVEDARIISISSAKFASVLGKHSKLIDVCWRYANALHRRMEHAFRKGEQVDDTFCGFTDIDDLLAKFPSTSSRIDGSAAAS